MSDHGFREKGYLNFVRRSWPDLREKRNSGCGTTVSDEIPCLDVVRQTLGDCRRNRMAIAGGRLRRFHQKRVVVLLVAGCLGAQNQDLAWPRRKAQTENTTALSRLRTGVDLAVFLYVARGVLGAISGSFSEFMADGGKRFQLLWLGRIEPAVKPRGKEFDNRGSRT